MARIYISNDPSGRIIVSFPYDPIFVSSQELRALMAAGGILKKNIVAFQNQTGCWKRS